MSFIAILVALLLEQARPLAQVNPVHHTVRSWTRWVLRSFDAGQSSQAWWVWSLVAVLPAVLAFAVHWLLDRFVGLWATVLWAVAVLYVTLGFRQFSHHFTEVRDALHAGDEALARTALAQWMGIDTAALPRSTIVQHVIEHSILSAHRHVFGVFFWYSLLAALGLGPAGAVLYRVAEYLSGYVNRKMRPTSLPVSAGVKAYATQAWVWVDWVPARVTALSFAFVGSFEEAVDSWRLYDAGTEVTNDGVILAATAGAINVRLGPFAGSSEAGQQQPQLHHLRAVVGLVWRTVVMWMVFLALLSLARLLG